ncbi:MAG: DNA polymerase III subunit chi [Pseudomonadota bacterium]|nr:DNA polymerase III subunit chi [Pseudomonadota bacterium]
MTRVDFYILQDMGADAAMRFACRLSLKAMHNRVDVHVQVDDAATANAVDTLMWDYPQHRFLPHQLIQSDDQASTSPIHVGFGQPVLQAGLLINLAAEIPRFFGRFDRVAEIIVGANRDQGRTRYKYYRDRGFPLHHHELSDWED